MSRVECMQMCLNEQDFECRSANYDSENNECSLSDMDRHTITYSTLKSRKYGPSSGSIDYLENNCIQGLNSLCKKYLFLNNQNWNLLELNLNFQSLKSYATFDRLMERFWKLLIRFMKMSRL